MITAPFIKELRRYQVFSINLHSGASQPYTVLLITLFSAPTLVLLVKLFEKALAFFYSHANGIRLIKSGLTTAHSD